MSAQARTLNRETLLYGHSMLVVYREPKRPPPAGVGQPRMNSDWLPNEPEIFIAILADGRILAFNGHVDLGTGIRTALTQIVAEELAVPCAAVTTVLGDSRSTPNQGPTIASLSIQVSAIPLRCAAAQARRWLIESAAERIGIDPSRVDLVDGEPAVRGESDLALPSRFDLLADRRIALVLDESTPIKARSGYRVVGQSVPRTEIPAKVAGELVYVQDMRVPGMLHGRVVRPPWSGRDRGDFVGHSLVRVDRESIADLPGVVAIVVERDFVGVVAEREEQAIRAAEALVCEWQTPDALPDFDHVDALLSAQQADYRALESHGDVEAAMARDGARPRRYVWPYQLHGSIGPSCSLADYRSERNSAGTRLVVWSGSQNPHTLRSDLATLTGLGEEEIEICRMETSGCYGRNCADDVGADATLLSRAVGRPVRVQLSRAQEHLWEPKGAAQVMTVSGSIDRDAGVSAYDFCTRYPSDDSPNLALLLTGARAPNDIAYRMGDRTAVPPYAVENLRVACDDIAPIVRASWFRGVSAMPNSFAHESWFDEAAYDVGADPLDFRLRHLKTDRARATLQMAADRIGWQRGRAAASIDRHDAVLRGRGLAYAHYIHGPFPGLGAALAAWAVDVVVDVHSGRIGIERVVVAHDAGLMINPDGVRHQVHGNVIQTLSRTLKEALTFDTDGPVAREWGGYPMIGFEDIPDIDVVLIEPDGEPALGVGESASLPGPAAIANAVFDATGIRLREAPFTAARVLAALTNRGLGADVADDLPGACLVGEAETA